MRTSLLTLAVVLLSGCAEGAAAQVNLVADPGFEEPPVAGRGGWVGTQNAGQAVFERCAERPHSGRWAAKLVCRGGDVYARWVYRTPDLFATVKRGDRLKLSFWYRASAALGDALVQISHDAAPGWEQYPLKRLKATGDAWVLYEAVFAVAVNPTGGGEVQLRGTTDHTGDQASGLYAGKLAQEDFVTLAYDASYQGESGGDLASCCTFYVLKPLDAPSLRRCGRPRPVAPSVPVLAQRRFRRPPPARWATQPALAIERPPAGATVNAPLESNAPLAREEAGVAMTQR